jgi:hypothetical protein
VSNILLGCAVFVLGSAGALFGIWLGENLPENHRTQPAQDVTKLRAGMLSVLSALVLGLLAVSVKTSFDTTELLVRGFASDLILLDDTLLGFGPQTAPLRALLRSYVVRALDDVWPENSGATRR